jgi:short-subunit dehydrogenase involved in D-alanine esterification of teichoic acids
LTYIEKVEKITSEDCDYVDSELHSLAQWLKNRYPDMDSQEINRFIRERLSVSV